MIEYLTLILACQLLGEIVVTGAEIPFPGPVVGMVLLFAFLAIRGKVPRQLGQVADTLLSNLSLLFVPAGVGVMLHFDLLGADAMPLSVALLFSTLATIAVTAWVMVLLNRLTGAGPADEDRS
jgi:putative effector of murein hydrolase LrgA (UPF0299 family)